MTQTEIKELLHYAPDTGVFTWRRRARKWFTTKRARNAWNAKWAGKVAGCLDSGGYLQIGVRYVRHRSHRLAFLYMHGETPEQIDHINHVRDDNRWVNLRSTNSAGNNKNRSLSSSNTSGVVGVSWDQSTGKWVARVKAEGRYMCLGRFTHREDAIAARKAANIKYDFHSNHGLQLCAI